MYLNEILMQVKKTLNLPKDLLEKAVRLSGASFQTRAIVLALNDFVQKKKREGILKLKGKGRVCYEDKFIEKSRRKK